MKTMKYVANIAVVVDSYLTAITEAESYEEAKPTAYQMMGYLNGIQTVIATMNNDEADEIEELMVEWHKDMWCKMVSKAYISHLPEEKMLQLVKARDEAIETYRAYQEA